MRPVLTHSPPWFRSGYCRRNIGSLVGRSEHALAVRAVASVDHERRLGDLVAQRTALATAGLGEFRGAILLCSANETSVGDRIVVAVGVIVPL